ncbi:unnamed protein product [Closterium sp. NIES-53]
MAQKLDGPPRFTGSDFSLWRFQFTLWLGIKDLKGVLEGSERRPGVDEAEASAGVSSQEGAGAGGASTSSISEGSGGGSAAPRTGRHRLGAEELLKAQEAWDHKDKQAFQYLCWALEGQLELLKMLIDLKGKQGATAQAWKRVQDRHLQKGLLSILTWRKRFYTMERNYGDGETMVQYLQRVDEYVRALEELNYKVDEKEIIYTALQGLDQEANEALLQYLHLEQQKWTKAWIWEVLVSDEARKHDAGRGVEGGMGAGDRAASKKYQQRQGGGGKKKELDKCGKEDSSDDGFSFLSLEKETALAGRVLADPNQLILDSGATCGMLARQEYICTFTMGGCTVRKGGAVVMEAKLEKGLYLVPVCVPHVEKAHGVEAKCAACSTRWRDVEQVTADFLHLRMGHAGRQQLVECVKKGELKGVEIKEGGGQPSKCPDCTTGKLPRTSFPTSTTRASAPLELVHTDVCGPMQTPEREKGSKYFITFLDDFSRLNWVTLVKTNDEVAKVFKRWIRYAEREAGAKVKILRSDRGGEYMGKDLESFLEDKGITHQLSVAYTPQKNGAAERLNRTLIDLSRAMLAHAQLDHTWWGAAVQYANWVKNRMGSKGLEGKSPYFMWTRKVPSVSMARVSAGGGKPGCGFHEGLSYKGWKERGASTVGSSLQDPYTSSIFEGAWEDPGEEVQEQQEEQKAAAPHHEESPTSGSTPDPNAPAHDPEQPQGQQQQQQEKPQQPPQQHTPPVPVGRWQQLLQQQLPKSPRSPMRGSPLRRTTRISRPPERFTPSAQYACMHDYEVFTPVGKPTTLRGSLGMAASSGFHIHHMDVTTAYLHGVLKEELSMRQPPGFDDGSGRVCRLKKINLWA